MCFYLLLSINFYFSFRFIQVVFNDAIDNLSDIIPNSSLINCRRVLTLSSEDNLLVKIE